MLMLVNTRTAKIFIVPGLLCVSGGEKAYRANTLFDATLVLQGDVLMLVILTLIDRFQYLSS